MGAIFILFLNGPDHSNSEQKMAVSLDHFIKNVFLFVYDERFRLTGISFILILNGRDREPNSLDHPKPEHV